VLERLTDLGDHVRYAIGGDVSAVEITDANFAVLERVAHWQAAWRMFTAHPWLGVGIGNYAKAYASFALPRWSEPLGHAHNIYLHFLAETGLLGLAAYLVLIASAAAQLWRARTVSRGFSRALAIGALAMLAHLAVHSLVDNLYVQGTYLHVAAVLGIAHVAAQAGSEHTAVPRSVHHRIASGSWPSVAPGPVRGRSGAGG
jgi:putative inorganic carbon (HCO3(-)) transporter